MKKYILGLAALVCAIAFSAFTKPFTNVQFKLKTDPVVASIVTDDAQWSDLGGFFGDCGASSSILACTIDLNSTRSSYFHTVGSEVILNTFSYANGQSPKQDYLEITESVVSSPDRIISAIQPKHFNTSTLQYENASLGADLSFANASEVEP